MENINYKVWTTFYEEFANKILLYKNNSFEACKTIFMIDQ